MTKLNFVQSLKNLSKFNIHNSTTQQPLNSLSKASIRFIHITCCVDLGLDHAGPDF